MTPIKVIPPEVLAMQLQVAALRSALLTVLQLDPGRAQLEHVGAALSAAPAVVSQLVDQNERMRQALQTIVQAWDDGDDPGTMLRIAKYCLNELEN
jgi:predicted component of type VI protein secretion system